MRIQCGCWALPQWTAFPSTILTGVDPSGRCQEEAAYTWTWVELGVQEQGYDAGGSGYPIGVKVVSICAAHAAERRRIIVGEYTLRTLTPLA